MGSDISFKNCDQGSSWYLRRSPMVLVSPIFYQTPFLDGRQTITDCQVLFPSVFGKMPGTLASLNSNGGYNFLNLRLKMTS